MVCEDGASGVREAPSKAVRTRNVASIVVIFFVPSTCSGFMIACMLRGRSTWMFYLQEGEGVAGIEDRPEKKSLTASERRMNGLIRPVPLAIRSNALCDPYCIQGTVGRE